ncbi:MAG: 30S ribosome-binding factor RbfA [Cytophagales bacterium]|nr:30S ribosome-binding factor RbfA [Cytophagales bacterium]
MADSKRQKKYSRLIQKDLGEIFQREGRGLFDKAFVTITEVVMSPDLSLAKGYVSALMTPDKRQLVEHLNNRKYEIRGFLGHKIGKHVKAIPELHFYLDNAPDHADRIDKVFKELQIPDEKTDGSDDVET